MQSIISPNTRIRYGYQIGIHSIIDDFCYISTQFVIGDFVHIASNCTIAGGNKVKFTHMGFGSLASGVKVFCGTDDFVNDLAVVLPKELCEIKDHIRYGNVLLSKYVTVGANSVIMPNNYIPEGTCIGALSFVPSNFDFEPWSIYAGYPKLKLIKKRNKENVLKQVEEINRRINK